MLSVFLFGFFFNSERVKFIHRKAFIFGWGRYHPHRGIEWKGEIIQAMQSRAPDLPHQWAAWSDPLLSFLVCSSLVYRRLGDCSEAVWVWEGMPLPTIPRGISLYKGSLTSLWCFASPALPTKNIEWKQDIMWQNVTEKNVDDDSSEPPA